VISPAEYLRQAAQLFS